MSTNLIVFATRPSFVLRLLIGEPLVLARAIVGLLVFAIFAALMLNVFEFCPT
jgi:type III secretory pathway component EscS